MRNVGRLLIGATVFLCAVAPFVQATGFGFANLDDYYYTQVANVTSGLSLENIKWAFTHVDDAIWMPFTWISYQLDWSLSRLPVVQSHGWSVASVMHAHSLLLHGLNAVLFLWLLTLLLRAKRVYGRKYIFIAVCLALFWAVHPLRVESVVWISSRKDVLSMAGLLTALSLWVRFRMAWNAGRWIQTGLLYLSSVVVFALSACCKPSVMCFPALCLVMDVVLLRCVELKGLNVNSPDFRPRKVAALLPYVPTGLLALAIAYEAAWAQKVGGATEALADVPFWGRVLNAIAGYAIYLYHTIVPCGLCLECINRWPLLPRFLAPGLLIVAGVFVFMAKSVKSFLKDRSSDPQESVLFGCLWYTIAVFPMLGLANFGVHAFADRFTYIPALAFSIVLLFLVVHFRERIGRSVCPLAAALVLGYGVCAMCQTRYWRNDLVMWQRTVDVDGEINDVAQNSLGLDAFEMRHDVKDALRRFRKGWETNHWRMLRYIFPYILALAEEDGDNAEEARAAYKYFTDYTDYISDKENSQSGAFKVQRKNYTAYRYTRLAYLLADPSLHKVAEEELDAYLKRSEDDQHMLYMKSVLCAKLGDKAGAALWRNKVRRQTQPTDPYFRYRWLGKEME